MSLIIGFLALSALSPPEVLYSQEKPNVSFDWAFGALTGSGKDQKFVPITKDTALRSGDQLKLMVRPKSKCFVYVIYESPEGETSLEFPYEPGQFSTDYKIGKAYFVPAGDGWFKLDGDVGRETFYLLASADRLTDLEALLERYGKVGAEGKRSVAEDVITEIRNVRKRYMTFTTFAERPISIGGNVRGVGSQEPGKRPNLSLIATEISALNFYGRTYTIDHKSRGGK